MTRTPVTVDEEELRSVDRPCFYSSDDADSTALRGDSLVCHSLNSVDSLNKFSVPALGNYDVVEVE